MKIYWIDLINYSIILLSYYSYEQEYNMHNDLENGEKDDRKFLR